MEQRIDTMNVVEELDCSLGSSVGCGLTFKIGFCSLRIVQERIQVKKMIIEEEVKNSLAS